MKDSKTIISHLVQQPFMKKYEQAHCYERLLGLLPKSFTCMIRFLYAKNETLFFVLNHPGAKMEFNYKRNLIKSLLSQLKIHCPECSFLEVKDIQCFVTNLPVLESFTPRESSITYNEQAQGSFENHCEEESLHRLFEEIRSHIHSKTCL
ncbi:MAG: hypothetical protein PHN18_07910 [Sulfurospirillaceae bacterium]|jgi:hypothetical protein|nr:hypothetical protein [Sulfurospirillaceae bacterium]MDD2827318.1 hypothetical protein [Sulfurospirillaceae bacterium]